MLTIGRVAGRKASAQLLLVLLAMTAAAAARTRPGFGLAEAAAAGGTCPLAVIVVMRRIPYHDDGTDESGVDWRVAYGHG